jgi:hypothetical protein
MEDEFYVEKIIDKKYIRKKLFYRIKWLGYGFDEATWEPTSHIPPSIKRNFNSNARHDNEEM